MSMTSSKCKSGTEAVTKMPDHKSGSTEAFEMPVTSSEFGTETVTITVGHDNVARRFVVHRDLISKASDFFRAAFNGSFKEARQSEIDLPEERPTIFEAFVDWLYYRRFQEPSQYDRDILTPTFWLRVYAMASRQLITDLQKLAFRQILVQSGNHAPTAEFVEELFNDDFPKKVLEDYFIRQCAFHLHQRNIRDWKPWSQLLQSHQRFGMGVAIQVAKLSSPNYYNYKNLPSVDMEEEAEEDDMETEPGEEIVEVKIFAQISDFTEFEQLVTIKLPLSWTIAQSKATIQAVTGIQASKQKVSKDWDTLEDKRTLASYNIQNGSTLYVETSKKSKDWLPRVIPEYL